MCHIFEQYMTHHVLAEQHDTCAAHRRGLCYCVVKLAWTFETLEHCSPQGASTARECAFVVLGTAYCGSRVVA